MTQFSKTILATLAGALFLVAAIYTGVAVKSQTSNGQQNSDRGTTRSFTSIPGGTYAIDPGHSSINFAVRHMLINNVRGRFTDFTGAIRYDEQDATRSSVEFTARVASVNTDVARRDEHLRGADFFDAARFPEMTFKSTRIERRDGANAYVAHGNFTLRGVTREVSIPFRILGAVRDARGGTRIGVEAGLTINRQDYGVAWSQALDGGGLVVANDVQIDLALEAIKRDAQPTATPNRQ